MTEEEKTEIKAEKYVYEKLRLLDKNSEQARYAKKVWLDGYHERQKEREWHDVNDTEPSKEQLGKQLLIRIESVIGDTDYDYLVYKYKGESITDVAGVIAWKEIE